MRTRTPVTWSLAAVLLAAAACADAPTGAQPGGSDEGGDPEGGSTSTSATTTATGAPDGSDDGSTSAPSTSGDDGSSSSGDEVDEPTPTFWTLESPMDSARTWLVSPSGERTFVLGVNTVMRDKQCDGIVDWIRRHPPTKAARVEWARLSTGQSGEESVNAPYCFNSVGAFSETNDFDETDGDSYMVRPFDEGGAGAPYATVLYLTPPSADQALRNTAGTVLDSGVAGVRIGDPFNPDFIAHIEARVAESVVPRRDDPNLQMWFVGNEIGLFDRAGKIDGVRDLRRWIWSTCAEGSTIDAPMCAPHALAAFLRERYGDVASLNAAWGSSYGGEDFTVVTNGPARPVPYAASCGLTCREDLQRFVHDRLLREWIGLHTRTIRAADPNHLIATPRLAVGAPDSYRFFTPASLPGSDVWADSPSIPVPTDSGDVHYTPYDLFARNGDEGFDLIAVNVYDGSSSFSEPWFSDGMQRMHEASGLPVFISEFSVRARISGWSNRGGAFAFVPSNDGTDDQIQRGAYYRSQLEQFASVPFIVGCSWHAWSDRYLAADERKQINMGLVRCDDPPRGFEAGARWPEIDERVAAANCAINETIANATGL